MLPGQVLPIDSSTRNGTRLFRRYPPVAILGLTVLVLVLFVVAVEASFVSLRYAIKGPMKYRAPVADHPSLGWSLNVEQSTSYRQNRCQEEVIDRPPPSAYLSKLPGFERPTRILFLGDSFTHGHEVSTGSRYYDRFEAIHADHYSVYAAGVGGYGSLQQFLLLAEIYPQVRPDVVVWQLHANDLANNVYEFEKAFLFNNQRPRPYLDLETSRIYIADPGHWMFTLESWRFLLNRLLVVDQRFELGGFTRLSAIYSPDEKRLPVLEAQGLEVLRQVLREAMAKFPHTAFVGFNAVEAYDSRFREVFMQAGAGYVEGLGRGVALDSGRTDCLPLDEHWNHHGNAVAGEILAAALTTRVIADMRSNMSRPGPESRTILPD